MELVYVHSEFLLIRITIIIQDRLMPKDIERGSEIIIEKIKLFRTFYEAQNEIFKKNNENI